MSGCSGFGSERFLHRKTRDDYNNLVTYLGGPSSNNSLFDDDLRMNTAA
jgi:hypothetical protein